MLKIAVAAIAAHYFYSILILLLGTMGLVNGLTIHIGILVAGIATYMGKNWIPPLPNEERMTLGHSWPLIIILLALSFVLFVPGFQRDDIIYHLPIAKEMLSTGRLVVDPYNLNMNFPFGFEALLLLPEYWGLPPHLVNWVYSGLLLGTGWQYLRSHWQNTWIVSFFILALASTPMFVELVNSAYTEIFLALILFVAFRFYSVAKKEKDNDRLWALAMFLLSVACSVKIFAVIPIVVLTSLQFFVAKNRRYFYKVVLISFIIAIPFYLKNLVYLGNPFYPSFAFLFPTPWLSPERSQLMLDLVSNNHQGRELIDYFVLPLRMLLGIDFEASPGIRGFGGKLSLMFGLAWLGLCFVHTARRQLSVFFIIFFALWAYQAQAIRYAVPFFIPFLLVGGTHFTLLRNKAVLITVLFISLMQNIHNLPLELSRNHVVSLLAGKISQETFLDKHFPTSHRFAKKVNELTSHENTILGMGLFGRSYFFESKIVCNTFYETEILKELFPQNKAAPDATSSFRKMGVDHILIKRSFIERFSRADQDVNLKAFYSFLESKAHLLLKDGDDELYRL